VGAESARTNRKAIKVEEELRRFAMILKSWEYCWAEINPRDSMQVWPPILSANTWRPEVVQGVLPMGVEWINDMSGLPDGKNAEHCADAGAALLIMHSVGEPKVPHFHQQWPDVIGSVKNFFAEKIELAEHCGLSREHLILDPGIDFAKQKDDNLLIYRNLEELTMFDRPLLVPVSRKRVKRKSAMLSWLKSTSANPWFTDTVVSEKSMYTYCAQAEVAEAIRSASAA
jgi:dihydropteroate synthase